MDLFLFVVLTLAAFRLTRLITRDAITKPLRARAIEKMKFDELINCDWCTGVWVALAVVVVVDAFISVPLPIAVWGAVAAGVGLLASWEG
jgi:hypothetical protein